MERRTGSSNCRECYSGNVTGREALRNEENTVQPGVFYSAAYDDSHCARPSFPSISHVFLGMSPSRHCADGTRLGAQIAPPSSFRKRQKIGLEIWIIFL